MEKQRIYNSQNNFEKKNKIGSSSLIDLKINYKATKIKTV